MLNAKRPQDLSADVMLVKWIQPIQCMIKGVIAYLSHGSFGKTSNLRTHTNGYKKQSVKKIQITIRQNALYSVNIKVKLFK